MVVGTLRPLRILALSVAIASAGCGAGTEVSRAESESAATVSCPGGWCATQVLSASDDLSALWAAPDGEVWTASFENDHLAHYRDGAWEKTSSGLSNGVIGLWGSARDDVFAVGSFGAIAHYDGSAWTRQSSGVSFTLWSVFGFGPTNVYAAGDDGVLHYDGKAWSRVTLPAACKRYRQMGTFFTSVWGSGPSDVYVAGGIGDGKNGEGRMCHYDGAGWSESPTWAGSSYLNAVYGSGPNDVWAAGTLGDEQHFDGQRWTQASSSTDYGNGLWHGSSGFWAVGTSEVFQQGRAQAEIFRLVDGAWKLILEYGTPGALPDFYAMSGNKDGLWVAGSAGTVMHHAPIP
jgi:hypothetical protein